MDMRTVISPEALVSAEVDALIVHLYAGDARLSGATAAVDRAMGGRLTELVGRGDLSGERGRVRVLFPQGGLAATKVIVVGLGPVAQLDAEALRLVSAAALLQARELGAARVGTALPHPASGADQVLSLAATAQALVEGGRLALYRYGKDHGVEELVLLDVPAKQQETVADGLRWGEATAEGVELARELVNRPPNVATPEHLAETARQLADQHGFSLTVGDRAWATEHGMGAFLAVTQAAGFEPRFIVLEHDPSKGKERPLVLVGKGVTFDSGGISIKNRQGMEAMKTDMAGGAAVLGAMHVLGKLRSPRRVVAIVPATENLLDAQAFRPSDVLTAANGTTIEIISTDAEGRLLLADALVYAQRYQPKAVVDLATLTGAVVVALGEGVAAGRFSNDPALAEQLDAAAEATQERTWPMPLWPAYLADLESDVADLKNSSGRPRGGAPVAAAFLERFVDYPWVHLDIAGMARSDKAKGYLTKGGTGYGVRLLSHWISHT